MDEMILDGMFLEIKDNEQLSFLIAPLLTYLEMLHAKTDNKHISILIPYIQTCMLNINPEFDFSLYYETMDIPGRFNNELPK